MEQPAQKVDMIRANDACRAPAMLWADLPDSELMNVRLCDLGLGVEGTELERGINQVYADLESRSLCFQPHFWLSAEWFTPDGVPGVAIPFYLAHPRLMQLEEKQMLEVEGGTEEWRMRLIRHEVGHAIDNAYRLSRRRKWRQLFGKSSQRYPDYYQPRPYSKRFVLHLDYWYAQSHPSEDFAETFAVWLTPGSDWQKRYKGWHALKKLEYVDELMRSIAGKDPVVTTRAEDGPLCELTVTLGEHYEEKRKRYGVNHPYFYDGDLRRLFSDENAAGEPAATFLRRVRPEIRRLVARWTGEYQYTIDRVLEEMVDRCEELKLRADRPAEQIKLEATILLTVQTMNFLHSGHHRLAI